MGGGTIVSEVEEGGAELVLAGDDVGGGAEEIGESAIWTLFGVAVQCGDDGG